MLQRVGYGGGSGREWWCDTAARGKRDGGGGSGENDGVAVIDGGGDLRARKLGLWDRVWNGLIQSASKVSSEFTQCAKEPFYSSILFNCLAALPIGKKLFSHVINWTNL